MIRFMTLFGSLLRKKNLTIAVALALVGCGGGSALEGGSTSASATPPVAITPAPTPTPTPTPEPAVPATPAVSLEGLDPIASGLRVADFLVPACGTSCLPGFESEGQEGAFRFICAPSHNAYDDPIVYPGQPGKSHLHTFFGNTKADANSTYRSLRTSGDSTCNNAMNRSAYWIPAMMNGHGKVVMPDYISIYYKGTPVGNAACTYGPVKACIKIPRGLRYIFGYNMSNPAESSPAGESWWNCDGPGATGGHYQSLREATAFCPKGSRVGAIIVGPRCWNGKDLDSADHRSHMAYLQDDHTGHAPCPATHPYMLPFFQLGAWYTNDGTINDWYLVSDRMPGMTELVPGTSLHADWFGAWEDSVLDIWTTYCINKTLNCSGGDVGDGQQLKQIMGYDFPSGRPLLDPPPKS